MKTKIYAVFLVCMCFLYRHVHAQEVLSQTYHAFGQKIPKTNKPFNDKDDKLQFLVVSDRTGGMHPGVFKKAAEKINQLQPEFVISVGDLIDGYTFDQSLLDKQWKEFDTIVEGLDMPFFYVPGNHDISNDWMEKQWIKRLGEPYYHFLYKNALFLVLHTEDGGKNGISDQQALYFQKIIQKYTTVRQIFLFMHRPVWFYEDKAGFEKIVPFLKDKPHTLFSGHHHHYYFEEKNGSDHFILGTTGGGSWLRSPEVGEFNHVTWVTLTDKKPQVTHLALDGIVEKNIVNKKNYEVVQSLRSGAFFNIKPTVSSKKEVDSLNTVLYFKNETKDTLNVTGVHPIAEYWEIHPKTINKILPPNFLDSIPVVLKPINKHKVHLETIKNLELTVQGSYTTGDKTISLPNTKEWVMDWHRIFSVSKSIQVDASLGDWSDVAWTTLERPGYFKEGWDWKGIDDCLISFAIKSDKKNISVAVQVKDEKFILDQEERRDKFYLYFSVEDQEHIVEIIPSESGKHIPIIKSKTIRVSKANIMIEGDTMVLEYSMPKKQITDKVMTSLRFNIGYMDHDNIQNTKPSEIFWKPVWGSEEDFPASGLFQYKQ